MGYRRLTRIFLRESWESADLGIRFGENGAGGPFGTRTGAETRDGGVHVNA